MQRYRIALLLVKSNDIVEVDANKLYLLHEAVELVSALRKEGKPAELYPEEYANVKISEAQACEIAQAEYNRVKALRPDNYGELCRGVDKPIYYSFYCRDYEKEDEGMTPGHFGLAVDKVKR